VSDVSINVCERISEQQLFFFLSFFLSLQLFVCVPLSLVLEEERYLFSKLGKGKGKETFCVKVTKATC